MERYLVLNGVAGDSIPIMKSSLYLTQKKINCVGRKSRAHPQQGRHQIPPYTKRMLEQGRVKRLKFTSDCMTLVIYLFGILLGVTLMHFYLSRCSQWWAL